MKEEEDWEEIAGNKREEECVRMKENRREERHTHTHTHTHTDK